MSFSTSQPTNPTNYYQPQGGSMADLNSLGITQNMTGNADIARLLGQLTASGSNFDQAGIQNAAAGQLGTGQAGLPYVGQALQQGFDPQQQLYHQLFNQNQQQTRAGESARGIAMSPAGQGLEDMSNQQFNLAWQNAQLGREQQGAQTANSLISGAGGAGGVGAGLSMGVPAFQQSSLQQANAIPQQQVQDYLAYLTQQANLQNSSTGGYNAALSANNQGFNQGQSILGDIGTGLGAGLSFLPTGGASGLAALGMSGPWSIGMGL